jgi:rhamnulokinase
MALNHHLACDLGAESGRIILGKLDLDQGKLDLKEIHRFPTGASAESSGALCWGIDEFVKEIRMGLRKAGDMNMPIQSLSTDSWGLDYLLFDETGQLMTPTYHYRDPRTAQGVERILERVDRSTIFSETGIQFLPINTLFQLGAESPDRLARARQLLLIGDGFNYLMSGQARAEVSLASTSQLYNPTTGTWSPTLLGAAGLAPEVMPHIVISGTVLGPLTREWSQASGLKDLEVVAGCSHDTGAAVAAVPAEGNDWAYISSGTWSLMGVELPDPILTDQCREMNFTNEIGYGNSVRLLKNLVGMWVVQECRRHWETEGKVYDYAALTRMAADAPPLVSLIHPSDPRFATPGDMPEKIAGFCRETEQLIPQSPGAMVRCVLESLALLYRHTLQEIQALTGTRLGRLHIVGGGSRNTVLNQLTANACQVPVWAGPVEATAAGNLLVQALARQTIPDLARARELVRHSVSLEVFQPQDQSGWETAYSRFGYLDRSHD